jgi:four helix bundle protein
VIRSFKDLEVYQLSVELYPRIVKAARQFPPAGFHLRDQVCRATNAIAADIAEGFGRSVAEFKSRLTTIGKKIYTLRKNWK